MLPSVGVYDIGCLVIGSSREAKNPGTHSKSSSDLKSDTQTIELAQDAVALTIAGSDPSGGAGLQADLKAFQQNGVYGMAVVTLLTVQNTVGVDRVEVMSMDLIAEQLESVLTDIPPLSIKTGALGSSEVISGIAKVLTDFDGDLIVDPVLVSKHGDRLAGDDAVVAYRDDLLPLATLITPNKHEAECLLDRTFSDVDSVVQGAQDLQKLGPQYVLIKAGTIEGQRVHVYADPDQIVSIQVSEHDTDHTHGAGCYLSATIAARMALFDPSQEHAWRMRAAVDFGIKAVHKAISVAPGLGKGRGPIESRILHLGDD